MKVSISLIILSLFLITRELSKVYQKKFRLLIKNVLLALILIVVNLTRLT